MAPTASVSTREERRERQKTERRESILAAARKVFARKGFDGTTMADVAREAGVAAGTVYLYYSSKTDVFAALNARLFEIIFAAFGAADAPPDLRGGTRTRIHLVFEACGRNRDLLRLIFLNPDPRSEVAKRMRRADEERLRPLVSLFSGAMEAGAVRRADPGFLANIINGLVTISLYQCFVQSDGSNVQEYEETVTEMIVGALGPA